MEINFKLATASAAVAAVHFALQMGVMFAGLAYGLSFFDNTSNTLAAIVSIALYAVFLALSIPVVLLAQALIPPVLMAGPVGYVPFVANSIVWGACFYKMMEGHPAFARRKQR